MIMDEREAKRLIEKWSVVLNATSSSSPNCIIIESQEKELIIEEVEIPKKLIPLANKLAKALDKRRLDIL
jgi:hypothetical protein